MYFCFTFDSTDGHWYFNNKEEGRGDIIRLNDNGHYTESLGPFSKDLEKMYEVFINLNNRGNENGLERRDQLEKNLPEGHVLSEHDYPQLMIYIVKSN